MKFEWHGAASPLPGELIYREGEYSIDFKVASKALLAERVGAAGNTSLSFTTLQIEVDIERGELLYPWGLFPKTRWQTGQLILPILEAGRVGVDVERGVLQLGVSVPLPESTSWPIMWDKTTGWICFGNPAPSANTAVIEYAKDAAVGILEGQLTSIWLRPKFVR